VIGDCFGRPLDPPQEDIDYEAYEADGLDWPESDPWEADEEAWVRLFVVPPDETEAALMRADELAESLEAEPAPKRGGWQADVTWRLAQIAPGVSLTELSDARELSKRPRLSASTPTERYFAPLWLLGAAGRTALARVRAERERLSTGMAPSKAARMRLAELRLRGGDV
jgi:hypothetical protein